MQDYGISITPREIASLTGRNLITGNTAYKVAKRRIEKLDTETILVLPSQFQQEGLT